MAAEPDTAGTASFLDMVDLIAEIGEVAEALSTFIPEDQCPEVHLKRAQMHLLNREPDAAIASANLVCESAVEWSARKNAKVLAEAEKHAQGAVDSGTEELLRKIARIAALIEADTICIRQAMRCAAEALLYRNDRAMLADLARLQRVFAFPPDILARIHFRQHGELSIEHMAAAARQNLFVGLAELLAEAGEKTLALDYVEKAFLSEDGRFVFDHIAKRPALIDALGDQDRWQAMLGRMHRAPEQLAAAQARLGAAIPRH